ncbi:RNA polymerase sigma factor SigX [Lottiidibacillus patelloidae]|uniref:RNA polymerase sigma factor n=1 Tax=Lottiidibacillus patelloidae TaxID=2670334 RepID=A0A263BVG9_9BACI|nr:RNA polymerase sigma factor SigX [Lottiidibacillus patelloidae]OZM57166.1 RNA polymerase sigma factor SigX [Lottiidibacillus patelloidae]
MKEQFNELYEKFHQEIFRFLVYMVKDKQHAEDLVQEVYIKVLDSYDRFRGQSSERTWIYSIARHVAIDWLRKQQRRKKRGFFQAEIDDEQFIIKDDAPLPEELLTQSETMKAIYQALENCTVDQKTVVILRYIQGLSISETAQTLNWSESKVKTTQHRAIKRLKKLFDLNTEDWLRRGVNE